MDLPLAISATEKCAVVLLLTGVAAPIAGVVFRRVAGGWDAFGKGPLAIDEDLPAPHLRSSDEQSVDPAILAAEVRQMLEAKASRRARRGEPPIDAEAEAKRLLEPLGIDAEAERELADLIGSR